MSSRTLVIAVLAVALYGLYQTPQYRPQIQMIWEQLVGKISRLEEEINRQIGYGGTSNLGPKSVSVSVPRSQNLDWQAVGALGQSILSRNITLKLEIDHTQTSSPAPEDVSVIQNVLQKYSGKTPALTGSTANISGQENYTLDDIVKITRANRSCYSTGQQVCLYILFLPGKFETSSALGVSFTSSAVAIFTGQLKEAGSPLVSRSKIAQAVLTHEIGHLFGLVNLTGKGIGRDDPKNPGHSKNQNSVMYWAVEDLSVGTILRGGPPTAFDSDDEAEIDAVRGGQ